MCELMRELAESFNFFFIYLIREFDFYNRIYIYRVVTWLITCNKSLKDTLYIYYIPRNYIMYIYNHVNTRPFKNTGTLAKRDDERTDGRSRRGFCAFYRLNKRRRTYACRPVDGEGWRRVPFL